MTIINSIFLCCSNLSEVYIYLSSFRNNQYSCILIFNSLFHYAITLKMDLGIFLNPQTSKTPNLMVLKFSKSDIESSL